MSVMLDFACSRYGVETVETESVHSIGSDCGVLDDDDAFE